MTERFVLIDKEDAHGVVGGSDYGSSIRIMARSPTHVLFNALGCQVWNRKETDWHGLKNVFRERPTRAKFEAAQAQIDAVFGEGAGKAVLEAWRTSKTVLVDGGGEKLSLPRQQFIRKLSDEYGAATCDHSVDLTGQIKTCLQCGANLRPKTDHHRMGFALQPDHPRTLEDCQRKTNVAVVAVHDYGMNYPDRWGHVEWFETWDGESLLDPHFCDDRCAAKFGRRAAEAALKLEPGIEPVRQAYVPRDDVKHYDKEPDRVVNMPDGRKFRI